MKKLLSIILALVLLLSIVPMGVMTASAETVLGGQIDKCGWSFVDDLLTISGEGEIPDEIDHQIKEIENIWEKVTKVVIKDGITNIPAYMFYGFVNLTDVSIPNSVTYIGPDAFTACKSLTSVTIPTGVTKIYDEAFSGCESLANITIPDSVIEIGKNAFRDTAIYNDETKRENGVLYIDNHLIAGNKKLSGNFKVKDGTITISSIVFIHCKKLESVQLPESVVYIGDRAFYNCQNLVNVNLPKKLKYIGSEAFYDCAKLTDITIPDSVESIGSEAFYGCKKLTSINIPKNVEYIGEQISEKSGIKSFSVSPKNKNYSSKDGVLFDKDQTSLKEFPNAKGGQYTIPSSVIFLSPSAFKKCKLTSITIPGSVKEICDNSFISSKKLETVIIEEGIEDINSNVFENCSRLKSITLPKSLKSLGLYTFENCKKLSKVTYNGTKADREKIDYLEDEECYNKNLFDAEWTYLGKIEQKPTTSKKEPITQEKEPVSQKEEQPSKDTIPDNTDDTMSATEEFFTDANEETNTPKKPQNKWLIWIIVGTIALILSGGVIGLNLYLEKRKK